MFGWEGERENDGGAHLGPQKKFLQNGEKTWRKIWLKDKNAQVQVAHGLQYGFLFFIFSIPTFFFFLIIDTSR